MKITFKVQLPGKCSSRKRGPSGTIECKALLTCSGSSLLPSVLRYHTGRGWIPGSAGRNFVQLSFSAPLSTQQSRVRFHPWVSERMWAWSTGGNAVFLETLGTQHPPLPLHKSVWPAWHQSVVLDESLETLRTLWDPFRGSQKPKAFVTSQLHRSLSLPVSPKSRMAFLRGCLQHKCRCIQTDKAEQSHH